MKRYNFVLLEILIAFALVSISILPFMHYPFEHMRKEIDLLFEMELEKIVQNELVDTQICLYRKEINLDGIFKNETKKHLKTDEEVNVEFLKGYNRTYLKSVTISKEKQKLSDDKVKTVFLNIEVKLTPKNKKEKPFSAETKLVTQKKI